MNDMSDYDWKSSYWEKCGVSLPWLEILNHDTLQQNIFYFVRCLFCKHRLYNFMILYYSALAYATKAEILSDFAHLLPTAWDSPDPQSPSRLL